MLVRFHGSRLAPLALAMALSAAPEARAQDACPENMIWAGCWDAIGLPSQAPSFTYEGGSWNVGAPCPTACYNLPNATFVASGHGDPWGPGCVSGMRVSDRYTIEGLPPGTPVSFFVELHAEGTISGLARYHATIDDGVTKAEGASTDVGLTTFVAKLPLAKTAGTPFVLTVLFDAGGSYPGGDVTAYGSLWFSGLPAGASVRSCQNYDLPVPATTRSWGSLKAIYRD